MESNLGFNIFLGVVFLYLIIYTVLLRSWLGLVIIILLCGELYYFRKRKK